MTGLKPEPREVKSAEFGEDQSKAEVKSELKWLRRHIEELGAALSGRRDALREVFEKGEEIIGFASEASGAIIYDLALESGRFRRVFGLRQKLGFDPDKVNLTHDWWCHQIHPEDRTAFKTGFAGALETGAGRARYRIRGMDGRYIAVEDVMKTRAGSWGSPRSLIGCIVDDSQRKDACGSNTPNTKIAPAEEEQWRCYAQKLESINRDLQNVTSLASCNLLEPLRKIKVFGEMMATKWGKSGEAPEYLARMQNAASRMQRVLHGLQIYSQIDEDELVFSDVDLERVAREALHDLEERIRSTGAEVEVGRLPHARVHESQVRLLFRNLIDNGIKFQSEHNRPHVKIYAGANPQGSGQTGLCKVIVEDNGIGFDRKDAEMIFSPFQRLHASEEYDGIGMGLAICRKIVDRHGGSITAKSAAGKGSIFTVTFP